MRWLINYAIMLLFTVSLIGFVSAQIGFDNPNLPRVEAVIKSVQTFLDLSDTPGAYSANQCVVVNSLGTGLIMQPCNNTGSVNFSQFSDIWVTSDGGNLDDVSDISHNLLSNLSWSVAGHIIDSVFNMNSNSIIKVNNITANLTITDSIIIGGESITNLDNVSNFDDNVVLRNGSRGLTADWDVGAFNLDNAGRVGAGTSDPQRNLETNGTSPHIRIRNSADIDNSAWVEMGKTVASAWSRLGFFGFGGVANEFFINVDVIGNISLANNNGLRRLTIDERGNTRIFQNLTINTGRAGIGTTTPSTRLEVAEGNLNISSGNFSMFDGSTTLSIKPNSAGQWVFGVD